MKAISKSFNDSQVINDVEGESVLNIDERENICLHYFESFAQLFCNYCLL